MWGTRDMAGFLSIPAALQFRKKHAWDQRMSDYRTLVLSYRDKFSKVSGREVICDASWLGQMASVLLPTGTNTTTMWQSLWQNHKVEAMLTTWRTEAVLRLGFNAYNTEEELKLLEDTVELYVKNGTL
jgi:isopenicillin-N epimerase